jgi:L-asparaginase
MHIVSFFSVNFSLLNLFFKGVYGIFRLFAVTYLKILIHYKLPATLKITPYVGMAYPQLNKNIKAVLMESYHSGTVNTASKDLEKFCNTAKQFNIPVFLTGSETGFFYESKELYSKLGIQVLPTVTPISAYIKLWILCENNAKDIYKAFSKSIGGDIL